MLAKHEVLQHIFHDTKMLVEQNKTKKQHDNEKNIRIFENYAKILLKRGTGNRKREMRNGKRKHGMGNGERGTRNG